MAETTDNAFLGGRLQLLQPKDGYRAGVDPVLLAAACAPCVNARVLELGCGVGTALFCLAARVPNLTLTGVELHETHAVLARENAARNGFGARIVNADIGAMPADLRNESFDLVLANPPYFDRDASTPSDNESREVGRGEALPLADWITIAARRLAPKGKAVFICRTERVPEMLSAAQPVLGSLELIPLMPRQGRAARLVILRGRKSGRADFKILPPVTLHRGTTHSCDAPSYTPEIEAVLRQGAALLEN